jgi:hypothetical protein
MKEHVQIKKRYQIHDAKNNFPLTPFLTFILLMWTFGQAPNNASKWEMGFNSVA